MCFYSIIELSATSATKGPKIAEKLLSDNAFLSVADDKFIGNIGNAEKARKAQNPRLAHKIMCNGIDYHPQYDILGMIEL